MADWAETLKERLARGDFDHTAQDVQAAMRVIKAAGLATARVVCRSNGGTALVPETGDPHVAYAVYDAEAWEAVVDYIQAELEVYSPTHVSPDRVEAECIVNHIATALHGGGVEVVYQIHDQVTALIVRSGWGKKKISFSPPAKVMVVFPKDGRGGRR